MSLWKRYLKQKIYSVCNEISLGYCDPSALYFVEPNYTHLSALCRKLTDLIFTERMSEMGAHGLLNEILLEIESNVAQLSSAAALSSSLKINIFTMWFPYRKSPNVADFWANKQRQVYLLRRLAHWYVGP